MLLRYLTLGEAARHDLRRAQRTAAATTTAAATATLTATAAAAALPHEVREAHAATLGAARGLDAPDVRMQRLRAGAGRR